MCTKFVGKLEFNSLFWISSLTASEEGPTRRIVEDVETQCWKTKLPFQRYEPTSVALFLEALETIKAAADEGMRPMIHFDMHGLASAGLEITATQEFASWNALVERLRTINIASHNNLVVVSNACFGLHAIKQVTLTKACPFYILIAPEQEVRVGFLEDHTAAFYAEMFSSGDIMSAYRRHLAGEMRVFHCEKMFGGALAKYIIRSCKGKSKRQRREKLISEIFMAGLERTPANLKRVRAQVKKKHIPDQNLIDRFTHPFFIGKKVAFTVEDLMLAIDQVGVGQKRRHPGY